MEEQTLKSPADKEEVCSDADEKVKRIAFLEKKVSDLQVAVQKVANQKDRIKREKDANDRAANNRIRVLTGTIHSTRKRLQNEERCAYYWGIRAQRRINIEHRSSPPHELRLLKACRQQWRNKRCFGPFVESHGTVKEFESRYINELQESFRPPEHRHVATILERASKEFDTPHMMEAYHAKVRSPILKEKVPAQIVARGKARFRCGSWDPTYDYAYDQVLSVFKDGIDNSGKLRVYSYDELVDSLPKDTSAGFGWCGFRKSAIGKLAIEEAERTRKMATRGKLTNATRAPSVAQSRSQLVDAGETESRSVFNTPT